MIVHNVKPQDMGKRLLARARRFPLALERAFRRAAPMMVVSLRLRTAHKRKIDLGALYNGWRWAMTAGPTVTFFNVERHQRFVELGRSIGARMPPVAPIEAWAQRHGMPGAGWAIARAISKRGIPPTPILTSRAFTDKAKSVFRREVTTELAKANRA